MTEQNSGKDPAAEQEGVFEVDLGSDCVVQFGKDGSVSKRRRERSKPQTDPFDEYGVAGVLGLLVGGILSFAVALIYGAIKVGFFSSICLAIGATILGAIVGALLGMAVYDVICRCASLAAWWRNRRRRKQQGAIDEDKAQSLAGDTTVET